MIPDKKELEIELFNEADYYDSNWEPYDVTCAGCGKVLPCDEACLEEGDRWECPECWEKFNAQERAAAEKQT